MLVREPEHDADVRLAPGCGVMTASGRKEILLLSNDAAQQPGSEVSTAWPSFRFSALVAAEISACRSLFTGRKEGDAQAGSACIGRGADLLRPTLRRSAES